MDFPSCPACGQSVLDDEPESCPFCGAAMKAKPAAPARSTAKPGSPTAPRAAATGQPSSTVKGPMANAATGSPTTGRPGAATPGGKPTAGGTKPLAGGDDIPITADDELARLAVQATRDPSKTRPLQVKCPMCESIGYVPSKAAGGPVRCANGSCLVPIFDAPAPKVEKPAIAAAAPPPAKSNRMLWLVLGTALAVAAVGGGWYYLAVPAGSTTQGGGGTLSAEDLKWLQQGQGDSTTVIPAEVAPTQATTNEKIDWAARCIKLIDDVSLISGSQNRSKPLCRMLGIEAAALAGDLAAGRRQDEGFARVAGETPFVRVPGAAELGWLELAQGGAAASTYFERLHTDALRLPAIGRLRLQAATRAIAVEWAAGRTAEALTVAKSHSEPDDAAQLAALIGISQSLKQFRVDIQLEREPAAAWFAPVQVMVAVDLAARQQTDAMNRWLAQHTAPDVRADVQAAIGAVYFAQGKPLTPEAISGTDLPGEWKGLVLSRLARELAMTKTAAAAEPWIAAAKDALAAYPPGAEATLPDTANVLRYTAPRLPQAAPVTAAVCELMLAAHRAGQDKLANELFDTGLTWARSLGPVMTGVEARLQAATAAGPTGMRQQLKKELGLKTDNEARQAYITYRSGLERAKVAAEARGAAVRQVSRAALRAGQSEALVALAKQAAAAPADRRELLVPADLASDCRQALPSTAPESLWAELGLDATPGLPAALVAYEQSLAGKAEAAAAALKQSPAGSPARDRATLQLSTRLAGENRMKELVATLAKLDDAPLREEALSWAAAVQAVAGREAVVWSTIESTTQATEKAAMARGLVAGLPKK